MPSPSSFSRLASVMSWRLASLGANLTLWALLTLTVGWLVGEATRLRAGSEDWAHQHAPA